MFPGRFGNSVFCFYLCSPESPEKWVAFINFIKNFIANGC
nr:MAG TPA: hypothetical protein [Caudoviricetes sp.]